MEIVCFHEMQLNMMYALLINIEHLYLISYTSILVDQQITFLITLMYKRSSFVFL